MFDLSWSEMAVIMLVALIVIGPKDLPKVARTIGQWMGKARALARDFQRSLDDMAREAELDDIKKTITSVKRSNLTKIVKDAIDPDDDLERAFDVEDRKTAAGKPGITAKTGSSLKPPARPAGAIAAPSAAPATPAEPVAATAEAGQSAAGTTSAQTIEKPSIATDGKAAPHV